MCGIAGLLTPGRANPATVVSAARLLRHRGPDDEGFVAIAAERGVAAPFAGPETAAQSIGGALSYLPAGRDPGPGPWDLVLGSRRLAILDLSFHGHQPLCSPDRGAWIVHNGEIYNYRELASELRGRGHRFVGASDTEVVLAAYREWGTGCFERFNGMWGMAIWDVAERRLVLSRDRFGIKPLYYAVKDGVLAFASEIGALLATGVPGIGENEAALDDFLTTGRIDVRGAETSFAGIRQLEPGTTAVSSLDGAFAVERYYDIERRLATAEPGELLDALDSSVALRLRSDVPLGSSLSGGLDSSSVVALAQRRIGAANPMRAFTFGSRAADDEREFAGSVVRHVGAEGIVVEVDETPLPELLEQVVREQEEPIGSGSILAQRQVMKSAREGGVTVMLDGQGGDEVFAGYRYYHGASLADDLARLHVRRWASELRAAAALGGQDPRWLLRATVGELRRGAPGGSRLRRKQLEDVRLHLPALLHYEDRNSMTFSIETRLPFLDYRVVELGLALPNEEKIRDGWTKLELRRAVEPLLPREIVWRRDKVQFSAPQESWLAGPLRELAADLLGSTRAGSEGNRLSRVVAAGGAVGRDADAVWRHLAVEVWREAFAHRLPPRPVLR